MDRPQVQKPQLLICELPSSNNFTFYLVYIEQKHPLYFLLGLFRTLIASKPVLIIVILKQTKTVKS